MRIYSGIYTSDKYLIIINSHNTIPVTLASLVLLVSFVLSSSFIINMISWIACWFHTFKKRHKVDWSMVAWIFCVCLGLGDKWSYTSVLST